MRKISSGRLDKTTTALLSGIAITVILMIGLSLAVTGLVHGGNVPISSISIYAVGVIFVSVFWGNRICLKIAKEKILMICFSQAASIIGILLLICMLSGAEISGSLGRNIVAVVGAAIISFGFCTIKPKKTNWNRKRYR